MGLRIVLQSQRKATRKRNAPSGDHDDQRRDRRDRGEGQLGTLQSPRSLSYAEVRPTLACSRCMKEELNALTETIIGAALEVHRELGPGLLEHAYTACLSFELASRG